MILIFSLDISWICKILVYMLIRKIMFYSINLFTDCFETYIMDFVSKLSCVCQQFLQGLNQRHPETGVESGHIRSDIATHNLSFLPLKMMLNGSISQVEPLGMESFSGHLNSSGSMFKVICFISEWSNTYTTKLINLICTSL